MMRLGTSVTRLPRTLRALTLIASAAILAWGLGGCVASAQDPESEDGATETAGESLTASAPAPAATSDDDASTSTGPHKNVDARGNVSAGDEKMEPEPAPWIPGGDEGDGDSSNDNSGKNQPHAATPIRTNKY
jgi:hypothetical protein